MCHSKERSEPTKRRTSKNGIWYKSNLIEAFFLPSKMCGKEVMVPINYFFSHRAPWLQPVQMTRCICGISVRGGPPSCTPSNSTERGRNYLIYTHIHVQCTHILCTLLCVFKGLTMKPEWFVVTVSLSYLPPHSCLHSDPVSLSDDPGELNLLTGISRFSLSERHLSPREATDNFPTARSWVNPSLSEFI